MGGDGRDPAAGRRIPEVLRFPADLTTPVRAFLALTSPKEESFLLESVAGGETQARYSFLGFGPSEVFEAGKTARLRNRGGLRELPGHPAAALARWVEGFTEPAEGLPVPFLGGAVGWMDFSSFAFFEPSLVAAFPGARDPRAVFGFFTEGLVLDHLRQEGFLYRLPAEGEAPAAASARLQDLLRRLEGAVPEPSGRGRWSLVRGPDRGRFSRNLASVREAILAGDAYQVVLSEPFEGIFDGNPFGVYRRLRRLNPSPYHFYISLAGRQVVGASPEMLLRAQGETVATVPIAGTRRRGATAEEDLRLERDLLADPKELAEHAMLVDLARNDLGRACEPGTVEVPVQAAVERFSHVMHITSEVQGRLAPGRTALDALAAAFPAGTVSGAPKIRAAQILSRLEGEDRGLYGGAAGVVDPAGNLELCIAIRTLEFEGGRVRFRSGAGIVADSREGAEWEEIHQKAAAALAALAGE
ncbi:MAG: anthranilate synthase component I family protein [Acidobacteriota bacterium]